MPRNPLERRARRCRNAACGDRYAGRTPPCPSCRVAGTWGAVLAGVLALVLRLLGF